MRGEISDSISFDVHLHVCVVRFLRMSIIGSDVLCMCGNDIGSSDSYACSEILIKYGHLCYQ